MTYYSPLRYPGGKGKLGDFIKAVFKANLLCDGCYIEPYAGGAAIALDLLMNEYANRIIINDVDRSIFAFWHSVLNKPKALSEMILKTKVDVDVWKTQRRIQQKKSTASLLELGFSTFFLNRTNRSGIINGGIIGGLDQTGPWKIDARFNKQDLISRIEKIARYKNRIDLYNLDACDLVKKINSRQIRKGFIYFDPPYYLKGKKLYVNYYTDKDHAAVAKAVSRIKTIPWIVSYDYSPKILELYKDFRHVEYSVNYSAASTSKGNEIMIFSPNVQVPDYQLN